MEKFLILSLEKVVIGARIFTILLIVLKNDVKMPSIFVPGLSMNQSIVASFQ